MSERLFPGLREYLVERFGPESGETRLEQLATRGSGIKEGGYGLYRRSREGTAPHLPGGPRPARRRRESPLRSPGSAKNDAIDP